MSFGYSAGDAILLTQLAWKTVQNARKACGEHDELTQEAQSLHTVLRRLEHELGKPTCPINRDAETYEEEFELLVNGCKKNLNVLDQVLTKYNALSEQERSGKQLWQKIRFGNGKMTDMADLRARLTYYTSATTLFLNMVSLGTMGRVERQLNDAGGDLREIKVSINEIAAQMMSKSKGQEGSILTAYADDDKAVWKEFRRELVRDGFSSWVIRKYKQLIKSYIEELGSRGLFDDRILDDGAEEQGLKSDLTPDDTAVEQDIGKYPAPIKEVEGQDLESRQNPNNEGEVREPKVDPNPNDIAEVQDLINDQIIDDALRTDLDTHRGPEASLGPQVVDKSSVVSNCLTITESFENLSEIFEHRSKTVDSTRVRKTPFCISFTRQSSRTNFNANLPSSKMISEERLNSHMSLIAAARFPATIDRFERKKLRFYSLLTVTSDSEILEVFLVNPFKFLSWLAKYKGRKSSIVYKVVKYKSLQELYQDVDQSWNRIQEGNEAAIYRSLDITA